MNIEIELNGIEEVFLDEIKKWIYQCVNKQLPKKPKIKEYPDDGGEHQWVNRYYVCGECGELIGSKMNEHCSHCGQKIDWSEQK